MPTVHLTQDDAAAADAGSPARVRAAKQEIERAVKAATG